jgi:thymidylate synthase (FAD)
MKVKLISYTRDLESPEKSIQDIVSYCARVSNPSNQNMTETNEKLIKYLMKHEHWSPFEMVNICLEIETTRDIARQLLRHRSFSFQEFSQRYAVADLGFEQKEARLQDSKNRQNSIVVDAENEIHAEWKAQQDLVSTIAATAYHWAIEKGIAKEQARAVLPEGMTVSRLYMNGSLRSWIHYIKVRAGVETQKEHRDVAIACLNEISVIFPLIKEIIVC